MTALKKTSKTGTPDVRPLCAGEALRRFKALLQSELPILRAHLLPLQLAVGVLAATEVLPTCTGIGGSATSLTWIGYACFTTKVTPPISWISIHF